MVFSCHARRPVFKVSVFNYAEQAFDKLNKSVVKKSLCAVDGSAKSINRAKVDNKMQTCFVNNIAHVYVRGGKGNIEEVKYD